MINKLFYLLIFILLVSCFKNNDNYTKSLKLKKGMSIDSLIQIMGEPDGIYIDSLSSNKKRTIYYYYPPTSSHSDNIKIFIDSTKISRIDNDLE